MKLVSISQHEDYLAHHGVFGQKWGIKNGPPYPLENNRLSDKLRSRKREIVRLPKDEYARVSHEIMTNMTDYERKHEPMIFEEVGDFMYTAVNNFDGTFDIIKKQRLSNASSNIEE